MKKPTKPFQQSPLDAPKRIRLLKRGGRLTPEWYYPDTAVGPHEASFVFVREQAAHIGALIDGWEGLPNDWKADLREGAPAFVRAILALHDDTVSGGQAPDCNELRQVARMALQQFEFTYGRRERGWDVEFLMARLRAVLSSDAEEGRGKRK